MEDPVDALDDEAGRLQQFGQLGGVEFAGVERVDRGVAAGGEGDAVRGRHQQHPAGPQHPQAFGDELSLVPQVFDHLEVDHHIDRRRRQRQLGEVALTHVDAGVASADVRDRGLVVVETDHAAGHVGDQVGAVALAAIRPRARRGRRSGRPDGGRPPRGGGTSSSPRPGRARSARRSAPGGCLASLGQARSIRSQMRSLEGRLTRNGPLTNSSSLPVRSRGCRTTNFDQLWCLSDHHKLLAGNMVATAS